MSVAALIDRLRAQDIVLWAEGESLRYNAPKGALTPELRAELSGRKAEIVAWLRGDFRPGADPIPRRGQADAPLSFAQERLWFVDRLMPGSPAYNIPIGLRLAGRLRPAALARAVADVVRRHEVLRTSCVEVDDQPRQHIEPPADLPLPLVGLDALDAAARETELERLLRLESARPFRLDRGPLLRSLLVRLAPERHVLLLTTHHFAVDGWSLRILVGELGALYVGAVLAELHLQFADFAAWQREHLRGDELERQLSYWVRTLAGCPVLDLPTDHPRPAVPGYQGGNRSFELPRELADGLRTLCRAERATPFMAFLAVFGALLHRYSQQDEVVVGTTISNRNREELEDLIGPFSNNLVLRLTGLADGPALSALLPRVREVALGAFEHQDLPFEKLVEELQPVRDTSRHPLFQVVFALQNAPVRRIDFGDLEVGFLSAESGAAKFDLSLALTEREGAVGGSLEYRSDLFEAPTITRLAAHFARLLEGAVADPGRPLSSLPLLGAAERHQLLVEWNDAAHEAVGERLLHRLVERQMSRTPDAVAVAGDGEALSYAELDRRAEGLARRLRGCGVGPEVRVGIWMDRTPALLVGLLAVLKSGGAYVPLDPAYPRERLAFMLADAGVTVLLRDPNLPREMQDVPPSGALEVALDRDWTAGSAAPVPAASADADNLAYVLYTSGSTGRPKGVQISHGALVNFLAGIRDLLGAASPRSVLAVTSLSFDIAGLELWLPLTEGGRVELATREEAADGRRLLTRLLAGVAGTLQATPATWGLLLDAGWAGEGAVEALVGGEAVPRALAGRLAALGRSAWNVYGPTETTIWSAAAPLHGEDRDGWAPLGRPFGNNRVHLLDRGLQPVPAGVPGELYIGGPGLARGYRGRPDLTAERFLPDGFAAAPGERLYRTGDLARYLPDGRLEYLGRTDHQVKVRGFRIELGEVEAALAVLPGVREVVVVAREDAAGGRSLAAYLVTSGERLSAPGELRAVLRERLPEYMVPAAFVTLDELPRTPNGKIDRRALPAPERQEVQEAERTAARTPFEELVVAAWCEVLGCGEVGIHDDFFALGGHSLLAARVISRLRRLTGIELPLQRLFETPTVAGLAAALEAGVGRGAAAPPLVSVPRTGPQPQSLAQQRLWYLHRLHPEATDYNMPAAVRVRGSLDERALEGAIAEIVRRHEILRTTFADDGGEPVQLIGAPARPALRITDLRALSAAESAARRLLAAEAKRPFDLTREPGLRVTLLRLSDEERWVLVSMHHIVSDGASMDLFLREMVALYTAGTAGNAGIGGGPPPLPEPPVQYADFARWERAALAAGTLDGKLDYWRRQLRDLPELALPPARRDLPPGAGDRRLRVVGEGLTREVRALGRRQGATLYMTLLAAYAVLLHHLTGQEDVAVGAPVARRDRVELEGLIGLFLNTLVLRLDLSGNPTFEALLARVRRVILEAHAHQDLPFERLVEELRPGRRSAATPLFSVSMTLQHRAEGTTALPGATLEPLPVYAGTAAFSLNMNIAEAGDRLLIPLEYRTDRFDAAAAEGLLEDFETILAAVAADPGVELAALTGRLAAAGRRRAEQARQALASSSTPGFRLSPQQLRLCALVQGREPHGHDARWSVLIEGDLDLAALVGAWRRVLSRHEALRTRFELPPRAIFPLQRVGEPSLPPLPRVAVPRLAAAGTAAAAEELWEHAELASSSSWDEGPTLRLGLFALAPQRHLLLARLPGLAADTGSLEVLLRDLAREYGAARLGQAATSPEPFAYVDAAEWLYQVLEGEHGREGREWWREHGAQAADLRLPFGEEALPEPFVPARVRIALPPGSVEALTASGRAGGGLSLLAPLFATWQVLLARHAEPGEAEPGERVVGLVCDGRTAEELVEVIGPLERCVPLRCPLEPGALFGEHAARVHAAAAAAAEWQECFTWDLLPATEDGGGPAFLPCSFHLQPPLGDEEAGGVRFATADRFVSLDRFALQLCVFRGPGGWIAELRHGGQVDCVEALRLASRFAALVENAAAGWLRPVEELDTLTATERHQALVEWNDSRVELGTGRCLHHLVAEQARRTPDRVAVSLGDQELSYAGLEQAARRLSLRLRAAGMGPDLLAAVCAERSLELVVGLLAILESGGAYVPLDPENPPERLARLCGQIGPRVLLTERRFAGRTGLAGLSGGFGGPVVLLDAGPEAGPLQTSGEAAAATPDHPAYVIFTSGSTGEPKGVMVSHRAILNRLLWMQHRFPLGAGEGVLQKTPYTFDASIWEIFVPLLAGGRTVLAEPGGHRDAAYLVREIVERQVEVVQFVPSLLRVFAEEPGLEACVSLRRVFSGGEALPRQSVERLAGRLGCAVVNLYGPTECSIDASFRPCGGRDLEAPIVPIGRPLDNAALYLLDGTLLPVPPGRPGELFIAGDGLARGYLGRPALTAERFVPDPFAARPGARLYRTGDLARHLPHGEVEFLGRRDHQVKVRGFRIELGEIEAALRRHPAVRDAVTVASAEQDGGLRLVAYVVTAPKAADLAGVRAFLTTQLPSYMVPALLVALERLPLTTSGKLDRRALPEPSALPTWGGEERPAAQEERGRPARPVEELLAGVWTELLGGSFGPQDDFFERGGHSLMAMRLAGRLRELLGVAVSVRDILEAPTLAGLAERIEERLRGERHFPPPPMVAGPADGDLPLSFAQQRLLFFDLLEPESPAYILAGAFRLEGRLAVAALGATLGEILRRHEVLRTTFATVAGRSVQRVTAPPAVPLPVVDLAALPPLARQTESARLTAEDALLPFDLSRGPLLRSRLLRLAPEEHGLLVAMHHIASDGWSMGVLVREVAALYPACAARELASPLPPLPIQYRDYARWQRQWLQGEVLEAEVDHWRARLAGAPPVLALPTDRPRPEVESFRGAGWLEALPAGLSPERVRQLAQREGCTVFMVLLAAFKILLHRWSGLEDLVVGTDMANRSHRETEGLIGFFVNLLPLRTGLGGNPTFREVLRRVRDTSLAAYAHQDLPFEKLVEELRPQRVRGAMPVVQVLFVLQNLPQERLELPGVTLAAQPATTTGSKFDLALFVWETGDGLVGFWNYKTDLFQEATIARLARRFAALLADALGRPDALIADLEILEEEEKKLRDQEQSDRREAKLRKLMNVVPRPLDAAPRALVRSRPLVPGQRLPLLVEPAAEGVDLAAWARSHRDTLERQLLEHGAILFRGFDLPTVEEFEGFASAACPDLFAEYGDLPSAGPGLKVYDATPYPADKAILFHNESSHLHRWPLKQFFYCIKVAEQGGETPLLDCRETYRRLAAVRPELLRRFQEKGLLYLRTFSPGVDVSWQEFFKTEERAVVEAFCRDAGFDCEWRPGDRLRVRQPALAVVSHPKTGEPLFFNQLQLHHVSCLDPQTRASLLSVFGEDDLPRNVVYGDGTPIEDAVMEEIGALYQELAVSSPWQERDVVMVDNMLIAHARNPYVGARRIAVAMGELVYRTQGVGLIPA